MLFGLVCQNIVGTDCDHSHDDKMRNMPRCSDYQEVKGTARLQLDAVS
jgi:hypothetical protein